MSGKANYITEGEVRDPTGRFIKGLWKGGPGNPMASRVFAFRRAMMENVTPEEVGKMFRSLVKEALAGDKESRTEVLDRVCGKAVPADMLNEIAELSSMLEVKRAEGN